jgi:hypothetical protein
VKIFPLPRNKILKVIYLIRQSGTPRDRQSLRIMRLALADEERTTESLKQRRRQGMRLMSACCQKWRNGRTRKSCRPRNDRRQEHEEEEPFQAML